MGKAVGKVTDSLPEEGTQAESVTPEQEESSFLAGFENVAGSSEPEGEELAPIGDMGGQSSALQDTVNQLQRDLRKLQGRYGALKDQSDRSIRGAEEKAELVRQEVVDVKSRLEHLREMEESEKEFGELTPFKEQLVAQESKISDLERRLSRDTGGVDSEAIKEQVESGILSALVPDWREVSQTKEFRDFMLRDGPTEEEYIEYAAALKYGQNSKGLNTEDYLSEWAEDFPGWWQDKGQKLFYGETSDSLEILDRYREGLTAQQQHLKQQETALRRRQNRLRTSSQPNGVSGDPVTGLSDDEAFSAGFKRVRGR